MEKKKKRDLVVEIHYSNTPTLHYFVVPILQRPNEIAVRWSDGSSEE
jgi:hypothetical protein